MMKTISAYILYTPLQVTFALIELGGSRSQQKDAATGMYAPDRSLTPLVLRPLLTVQDPDHVIRDGDHTDRLIDCRWYLGTDEKGERITAATPDFIQGAHGELQVLRNVDPSLPLSLYFSCAYVDERTNNVFRYNKAILLDTALATELLLSLTLDAAGKVPISPFKTGTTRTIHATLRNGTDVVPEEKARYRWMVYEDGAFRPVTADDLFYVSGGETDALTIDTRYIDREYLRCEASHTADPARVAAAGTKLFRWYGQWDDTVQITRGKYIRRTPSAPGRIEVTASVSTPKGVVPDPAQFFDIEHTFGTNEAGYVRRVIGYGERVEVSADIAGTDPRIIPNFGIETRERTALRAACADGKLLMADGKVLCLSVPKA
jgi:hypothetical protein